MTDRRTILLGSGATLAALGAGGWLVWTQIGSHAGDDFPVSMSRDEWRARLTEAQFRVLRLGKTERPFSSPLVEETRAGTYSCAGCGQAVYASGTKFYSDSGWPSFTSAIDGNTATRPDPSLGGMLTEVHCANCGGHLGHIFDDGPEPTGKRHCINGVALDFSVA